MPEKSLNFGKFAKVDPYTEVDMPILGYKEVQRKEDGKQYQLLVCQDEKGREVVLFDWALIERDGKPFVLKKHLASARADAAKN